MIRLSGQRGVPVITIGAEVVVGFDRRRIDELMATDPNRKASLGLSVADASRIALEHGVVPIFGAYVGRVRTGGPGERAGLRSGDIVTEVNLRSVRNAADLEKAVKTIPSGGRVSITWIRGHQTMRAETSL